MPDTDKTQLHEEGMHLPLPSRFDARSDEAGRDLLKLVLALVDLIRQLLERQAIRRMESGNLSEEEIERLGQAFLQMEEVLNTLKKQHGLQDKDLNIDLGPLGKLLQDPP